MGPLPLLFIDIDGVLSIWGATGPNTRPGDVWISVEGIPHHLSAEAAETLRGLADVFECVWASGWEEKANEHLPRAVGLGPWPHLELDAVNSRPGTSVQAHWKLGALGEYAARRPFAWIDDAVNDAVRTWIGERPQPALLVETDPAQGLTAGDGERLRQWAVELRP